MSTTERIAQNLRSTCTSTLCHALDSTPRRFHIGSTRSGCVVYDESQALHMIVTCTEAHTVNTRMLCAVHAVLLCDGIWSDSVLHIFCA